MVFLPCVNAACTNEEKAELNSLAAKVKANYEEAQRIINPEDYTIPDAIYGKEEAESYVAYEDYFKINILNITDKIKVEISNNYDMTSRTYTYQDTQDGVVSLDWDGIDAVTTFTIKVYADGEANCTTDALRTLYVTTPRYNGYSLYDVCEKAKELDVCQKYVTFKDLDYYVFMERVEKYLEKDSDSKTKTKDFFKENKKTIIIGSVALIVVAGVVVAVIMKKRSSEI